MPGASAYTEVTTIRIGSFNVGVDQNMLTGRGAQQHLDKIEEIIATCAEDKDLQIMNMCEVGGHRLGFTAANINVLDMNIFRGTSAFSVSVDSNYLTAWGFNVVAPQRDVTSMGTSKRFELTSRTGESMLIVHAFQESLAVRIILGNLHIRIPNAKKVTTPHKQSIVIKALRKLESETEIDSSALPVVLVLVGDCNLSLEAAKKAIQPMQPNEATWRTEWQVHTTTAALSGDLIFTKGAKAESFDLPFGPSHRDWGVRKDSHDAIAIELKVKAEAEPEPPSRTNRMCSDQTDGDGCQPGDASQFAAASQAVVCETQSQPRFTKLNLPVTDNPARPRDAFM